MIFCDPEIADKLHGLAKRRPEERAHFSGRTRGWELICLRPAAIKDEETMRVQCGPDKPTVNWQFIDRTNIALPVINAMRADVVGLETVHLLGSPHADGRTEVAETRHGAGWTPPPSGCQLPGGIMLPKIWLDRPMTRRALC